MSALIAAVSLAFTPLSAPAATTGLAWDSVGKFVMDKASSLQPGTFDADFQTASTPPAAAKSKGGFLGKMYAQAMANAQMAGGLMQNGIAERHYVAGTRERTDDVSRSTARILDCAARTITTLDLKKKTYKVVSMDQPHGATTTSEGNAEPAPAPTDDGSKVAIDVKNSALGKSDLGGESTEGYKSNIKMTTTSANGESKTNDMDRTAYYSSRPSPRMTCGRGPMLTADLSGMQMMGGYVQLMQSLNEYGTNNRFKLTQSGPALPLGKLAMWDLTTFTGGNGGEMHTGGFLTERGNVRTIQSDDSIFSVPSDFTKEQ